MPRGTLKLEVTEQLVMENPEQAAELLEWLHKAGASIAIDDFGTGYSALSYLSRFNFDTIKIDRSFLQDVKANPDASLVVRSIVSLAHVLGREIIAEGVETEDDLVFLRTVGCELGQGFLLSEPLTDKQAIEVLRGIRKDETRGVGGGFFGRVIGNVMGRRDDEDEEVQLIEPVKPSPARPAEAPRGNGSIANTPPPQRPQPGGPPTMRAAGPPPAAANGRVPPTGRPQSGPGVAPPAIGRPALASFERRPDSGPPPGSPRTAPPSAPGPGLAEFERRPGPAPEPAPASPIAEALPALDPALEQRIRSIFRDTALGGEPAASNASGALPRIISAGSKDKA